MKGVQYFLVDTVFNIKHPDIDFKYEAFDYYKEETFIVSAKKSFVSYVIEF